MPYSVGTFRQHERRRSDDGAAVRDGGRLSGVLRAAERLHGGEHQLAEDAARVLGSHVVEGDHAPELLRARRNSLREDHPL